MMKFRKKPVVIEAVQLRWDTWNEVCNFAGVSDDPARPHGCYVDDDPDIIGLLIPTLEGTMRARQDDWIIRGVSGELYPCKPDIFEKTYEPLEEVCE